MLAKKLMFNTMHENCLVRMEQLSLEVSAFARMTRSPAFVNRAFVSMT